MRHLSLACALWLLWASPVQATVTCSTGDAASTPFVANNTPDLTVAIPADANRITVLAVHDRGESATIDTVTDDGGGSWTLRVGPDSAASATIRTWFYERVGGGSGSTIITVTFAAAATPNSPQRPARATRPH
jgi:hypothetical protein